MIQPPTKLFFRQHLQVEVEVAASFVDAFKAKFPRRLAIGGSGCGTLTEGERISIGVQMLWIPRTLVLDEPQTGMDATSFFLFDRITLFSRGDFAYGSNCRFPGGLKPHVNPADYLIDIAAVDTRTKDSENELQVRVNMLLLPWYKESDALFCDR